MKKRTLLSIAAALLVTLNAGAFGFETVENAAEASLAETGAALTEDIDIPLVDEKYGDLIWYSNFETSADYKTATSSRKAPASMPQLPQQNRFPSYPTRPEVKTSA